MTPPRYYRIDPTTDELDPQTIQRTFAGWHTTDSTSRIPFLGSPPPILEILLVAPDDRTLDYYVATDRNHADLEHTLRQFLPTTYELTETTSPLDTKDDLAALEYRATETRHGDRLTHLTPFGDFHNETPGMADVLVLNFLGDSLLGPELAR